MILALLRVVLEQLQLRLADLIEHLSGSARPRLQPRHQVVPQRLRPRLLPLVVELLVYRRPDLVLEPGRRLAVDDLAAAGGELLIDDLTDEQPAGGVDLLVGEVLRLAGVEVEAAGDQQDAERGEQQMALALQARLAQQPLDRAVGHSASLRQGLTGRAVVRRPAGEALDRDRRAAARARLAVAAVGGELVLEAAGEAGSADVIADRAAAGFYRPGEHLLDGIAQAVGLGPGQGVGPARGV